MTPIGNSPVEFKDDADAEAVAMETGIRYLPPCMVPVSQCGILLPSLWGFWSFLG